LAAVIGSTIVVLLSFLFTGPASAAPVSTAGSTCDPFYGCTPSNPPGISPTCTVTPTSAVPGDVVTGTLSNVPVGTHARLLFDGAVVAEGDATGSGATGSVSLSFTVPVNTTGQNHTIVFVGAGFQCDPTGGAGFPLRFPASVLGAEFSNPNASTGGGGVLARTGIAIALFLAIALVLLLVGYGFLQAARRRRRRAMRRRNAVEHLEDHLADH
jgi:hypothetical protein